MSDCQSKQDELVEFANLLVSEDTAPPTMRDNLLSRLNFHGLSLLIDRRDLLPEGLKPQINLLKATSVANQRLKQDELATILSSFQDARIQILVLKGTALAYSLYLKPWLRPTSDIDLLIKPSDKKRATQVLKSLGYQRLNSIEGHYVSYQDTYGKALLGKSVINLDLHWHINNRQMFSDSYSVEELIRKGETIQRLGSIQLKAPMHIASVVDNLLIACIHRSGHHNKEERLIWLYDIHLLAESLSTQQWQQLIRDAKTKRISLITRDALLKCQRFFSTKVDNEACHELARVAHHDEPSSIFLNRSLSEVHYFWADLKSMPTFGSKLIWLKEILLPSPTYIRHQMDTNWTVFAYVKRFYRGIKRII